MPLLTFSMDKIELKERTLVILVVGYLHACGFVMKLFFKLENKGKQI